MTGAVSKTSPAIIDYDIETLLKNKSAQSRASLNAGRIKEYIELLNGGYKGFPAAIAFDDGNQLYLAGGFHRLTAGLEAGLKTFPTEIRKGTLRDALLFSVVDNSCHGIGLSNKDKRKGAMILLSDPEWRKWSSSVIAQKSGSSPTFVEKLRAKRTPNGTKSFVLRVTRTRLWCRAVAARNPSAQGRGVPLRLPQASRKRGRN